ncbi:SRPBCC family protein [Litchfieldella anticariensis]|uniref:SRPBCC family protein n=1 Tax=Litchfieldella anticariensis TaxID=258591 RepID=UPI0015763F05|nr:SRPBCC family protein [Halomonas anticariensis]
MKSNKFHFMETWTVPGYSPEEIWAAISTAHPCHLPRWWDGVYLQVKPLEGADRLSVGARAWVKARGFLPYKLRFLLEVSALEPNSRIEVRSQGDLEGVWCAQLKEYEDGSCIGLEWKVTVNKPIVRLLSPLLKPVFARNHIWTTPRGEAGLRAYMQHHAGTLQFPEGEKTTFGCYTLETHNSHSGCP